MFVGLVLVDLIDLICSFDLYLHVLVASVAMAAAACI